VSGLDVRAFTVGVVQENCYIVRRGDSAQRDGAGPAIIIDPGDEPERLLEAASALGVDLQAILITHCHFDHIGAVAPVAAATGAPVYCPEIERPVLADIMSWVPPGFGPFASYEADHTLKGGERLSIAGMDIEVTFTPGHSPGHLTYAISPSAALDGAPEREQSQKATLFSGDVLFAGSVGRVDLPGGDWATLERSIAALLHAFPEDTAVLPGHMGATTLGRERDSNPFLAELRAAGRVMSDAPASSARR
jgi:hydroxyacylglutathione hydrolase